MATRPPRAYPAPVCSFCDERRAQPARTISSASSTFASYASFTTTDAVSPAWGFRQPVSVLTRCGAA